MVCTDYLHGHAVVCADYLTVYTTTSASDVLSPRCGMECAWESDPPLNALLLLCLAIMQIIMQAQII